jgi:predicted membrane protein
MRFTINIPILQLFKTKRWRAILSGTREIIEMLLHPGSFVTTILVGSLLIFFITKTSFTLVSVFIAVCFILYSCMFTHGHSEGDDEDDLEEPECYE